MQNIVKLLVTKHGEDIFLDTSVLSSLIEDNLYGKNKQLLAQLKLAIQLNIPRILYESKNTDKQTRNLRIKIMLDELDIIGIKEETACNIINIFAEALGYKAINNSDQSYGKLIPIFYESKNLNANFSEQRYNALKGVTLQITVIIGTARRQANDILEITQGTIIELDRQAGAPVDVVINGNLIARGDVVVIDDTFAVRITKIIKSRFFDSLGEQF